MVSHPMTDLIAVDAVSKMSPLLEPPRAPVEIRITSASPARRRSQTKLSLKQSNPPKMDENNFSYELTCMDVSGCRATFSESQIQRFLDRAAYKRFDRLRTDNEIRKVPPISDSH
jgi:hypothetical protein